MDNTQARRKVTTQVGDVFYSSRNKRLACVRVTDQWKNVWYRVVKGAQILSTGAQNPQAAWEDYNMRRETGSV